MVKHGAVCGTSGKPGSDESLESMRGTLSKCEFRGTEIVDRDEISDEMTSGDVGSANEFAPFPRRVPRDLRRRRRDRRADSACLGGAGALSFRCMAFNSQGDVKPFRFQNLALEINEICREDGSVHDLLQIDRCRAPAK
jgi:hypothetical protein